MQLQKTNLRKAKGTTHIPGISTDPGPSRVVSRVVSLASSAETLALLGAFCNLDHTVFHTYSHGNCEILVASDRKTFQVFKR